LETCPEVNNVHHHICFRYTTGLAFHIRNAGVLLRFFAADVTSPPDDERYPPADRAAVRPGRPGSGLQPGADDPAGDQHVPGRNREKVTGFGWLCSPGAYVNMFPISTLTVGFDVQVARAKRRHAPKLY